MRIVAVVICCNDVIPAGVAKERNGGKGPLAWSAGDYYLYLWPRTPVCAVSVLIRIVCLRVVLLAPLYLAMLINADCPFERSVAQD